MEKIEYRKIQGIMRESFFGTNFTKVLRNKSKSYKRGFRTRISSKSENRN